MTPNSTDLPKLLYDGPEHSRWTVVLAHGAGAAMDTPFMNTIATGLAEADFRVVRFEFPYMARRRDDGRRRPPDRAAVLLATWRTVIDALDSSRLVIGGKSMGGRMASLIADEAGASALVCLGYPFHPAGKPDRLRTDHLRDIKTPTLILQGTRDALGNRDEVAEYPLSSNIQLHWLEDGDHSFRPRKSSGRSEQQNLDEAVSMMTQFIVGLQ